MHTLSLGTEDAASDYNAAAKRVQLNGTGLFWENTTKARFVYLEIHVTAATAGDVITVLPYVSATNAFGALTRPLEHLKEVVTLSKGACAFCIGPIPIHIGSVGIAQEFIFCTLHDDTDASINVTAAVVSNDVSDGEVAAAGTPDNSEEQINMGKVADTTVTLTDGLQDVNASLVGGSTPTSRVENQTDIRKFSRKRV